MTGWLCEMTGAELYLPLCSYPNLPDQSQDPALG